ncbi:hypothetical protein FKP32DRAFT_1753489 [Trametes sanguinea]|nr:hypothetical protein FKP32DRAFT_1753489 [Trametes sanguinea]
MKATYLHRVRELLSELAKNDQSTAIITFDNVANRIKDTICSEAGTISPRYRSYVQAAVTREARARRIVQTRTTNTHNIRFTSNGLRFYRYWGVTPLYSLEGFNLERLTILEIRRQSAALKGVIDQIQEVLQGYPPGNVSVYNSEDVLSQLQRTFQELDQGSEQATVLSQELAAVRAEERRLKRRILESETSGYEGRSN